MTPRAGTAVGTVRILVRDAMGELRALTRAHAIVAALRNGKNTLEASGRG